MNYLSASMFAVMERVSPLPPTSPGSGSGDLKYFPLLPPTFGTVHCAASEP
jgi:hypothetical protein